jgi:hypothetical protein
MPVLNDILTDVNEGSPIYKIQYSDTAGSNQDFYIILGEFWFPADFNSIMSAIKTHVQGLSGYSAINIYDYAETQTDVTSSF